MSSERRPYTGLDGGGTSDTLPADTQRMVGDAKDDDYPYVEAAGRPPTND